MEIIFNEQTLVNVQDIEVGDTFVYENNLYMRIFYEPNISDDGEFQITCVGLDSHHLQGIKMDVKVTPCTAKLYVAFGKGK